MGLNIERFSAIVDAYGGDPCRWPVEEREAAQTLLACSVQAQAICDQARQLDQILGAQPVPDFDPLLRRLERQPRPSVIPPRTRSPQGVFERVLIWLLPPRQSVMQWWRPAALACVPLLLGLVLGTQLEPLGNGYTAGALEEELYLISLSDYAETL